MPYGAYLSSIIVIATYLFIIFALYGVNRRRLYSQHLIRESHLAAVVITCMSIIPNVRTDNVTADVHVNFSAIYFSHRVFGPTSLQPTC